MWLPPIKSTWLPALFAMSWEACSPGEGESLHRQHYLGTYLYLQKSITTPLLWEMQLIMKVAKNMILNQFNKIIQVDFKSFLQLI